MYEPLTDPAAIAAANQFFDDIIAQADPGHAFANVRPVVEDLRTEALTHAGMLRTQNQIRGFLWGLMAAEALTVEQARTLSQRLDSGRAGGWL